MQLIVSANALKRKYGVNAQDILRAIEGLGPVTDVSGLSAAKIQARIAKSPASESVCLLGGYDLVPAFVRKNPTAHLNGDDDRSIPTDAPYGASPGVVEEEYAPTRVVSRIPDGGDRNAAELLAVLKSQKSAPATETPAKTFEEAANEFKGAAGYVHRYVRLPSGSPSLSPPSVITNPDPIPLLSGSGRVHVLLHGANFPPEWASLFGRSASAPPGDYPEALSAPIIEKCPLTGSVVTFSSCYAAMLDGRSGRTSANQVALACLVSGAKVVVASTRSNWIQTMAPYSGLGPGLVGAFWKELAKKGRTAGEAFRRAKQAFLKAGLAGDAGDHPYILKTVLQAQLYGHPEATL
jgi:peptidase C25-like protein